MVLIENPGWSLDPLQNSVWILDLRWRSTCIQAEDISQEQGAFQLLMSLEMYHWKTFLSSPCGGPLRKETRILEKSEGRLKWRAEPSVFFYSGQSYKSKRKIHPSSSAILGCQCGTEVECDKEFRIIIILHIICMNVPSCWLSLGMVRGDTVIQSSLSFTKI